jgi:hypothetical protein
VIAAASPAASSPPWVAARAASGSPAATRRPRHRDLRRQFGAWALQFNEMVGTLERTILFRGGLPRTGGSSLM